MRKFKSFFLPHFVLSNRNELDLFSNILIFLWKLVLRMEATFFFLTRDAKGGVRALSAR